ncbi:MAG: LytTR family transcriptional regulator [Firmicutes bacterium]|nr:LytTR family transcriptional regulator [Bacillota bacterium]
MKVKIICKEENYDKFRNIFEDNGFIISDIADYYFIEVDFQRKQIIGCDFKGNRIYANLNEICLVQANTYKNKVLLKNGSELFVNENLNFFEADIYSEIFIRANKSQVVNISEIRKISPQINSRVKLTLKNNEIVYITRTYVSKFKESIDRRRK